MISFFIKYRNPILITTVVIFLGSVGFLGVGMVADQYGANATLATVGETKVKYKDFLNAYNLIRQKYIDEGKEISEEQDKQLKQEIVQSLVLEEALSQEAEALGLGTSKMEVAYAIKNNPIFAPGGEFNKNAYVYVVRNQFHVNPAEFESKMAKEMSIQKLRTILAIASLPTSFEKNILTQGTPAGLKDEEKDALEGYLAGIKAKSLGLAFDDALNNAYKVSMTNKEF